MKTIGKTFSVILGGVVALSAMAAATSAEAYWGWRGGYIVAPAPYYPPPYRYYYAPDPAYAPPPPVATRIVCRDYYNPAPTILGGLAGGVIGSTIGRGNGRAGAIVGGALLGGVLGSQYAVPDRYCTRQVFEAAPVGQPYTWVNPDTHYAYTVTPERNFTENGMYCREYQATATVNGKPQATHGTACREPDGSWKIMN